MTSRFIYTTIIFSTILFLARLTIISSFRINDDDDDEVRRKNEENPDKSCSRRDSRLLYAQISYIVVTGQAVKTIAWKVSKPALRGSFGDLEKMDYCTRLLVVVLLIFCYISFVLQPKADSRSDFRHSVVRREPLALRPTPNRLKLIPTPFLVVIGILVVSMLGVAGALIYIIFFSEDRDEEDKEMLDQYSLNAPVDFWSQEGATVQEEQQLADQRYEAELSADLSTSRSSTSRSTGSERDVGKIVPSQI